MQQSTRLPMATAIRWSLRLLCVAVGALGLWALASSSASAADGPLKQAVASVSNTGSAATSQTKAVVRNTVSTPAVKPVRTTVSKVVQPVKKVVTQTTAIAKSDTQAVVGTAKKTVTKVVKKVAPVVPNVPLPTVPPLPTNPLPTVDPMTPLTGGSTSSTVDISAISTLQIEQVIPTKLAENKDVSAHSTPGMITNQSAPPVVSNPASSHPGSLVGSPAQRSNSGADVLTSMFAKLQQSSAATVAFLLLASVLVITPRVIDRPHLVLISPD